METRTTKIRNMDMRYADCIIHFLAIIGNYNETKKSPKGLLSEVSPVETLGLPEHPPLIFPEKEFEGALKWAQNAEEHSWCAIFALDMGSEGYLVVNHYPLHGPASVPRHSYRKRVNNAIRNLEAEGIRLKIIYAHNHPKFASGLQSNDVENLYNLIEHELKNGLNLDLHVIFSGKDDARAFVYIEGDFYDIPIKIQKFRYPMEKESDRRIFETYYRTKKESESLIEESLRERGFTEKEAEIIY